MTARKELRRPATGTPATVPVATIYQNSDQVAGVLQQLFGQPLIVEETRDSTTTAGDDTSVASSGSLTGGGTAKAPLLGALNVKASGDLSASGSWTSTTGTAARQQFVYSQAYYLHLVRRQLTEAQQLHRVTSAEDAAALAPGSFVEFTTAFDPVELTLALEVISPDLVDAIAQWSVRREYKDSFPVGRGVDAVREHAEKMRVEAEGKGAFARAVAAAVHADARQESTREYYGRITREPALTAITVCEREHFIAGDPDRLLDGTFTVFGKVISEIEEDVPTFARNKLLRNFSADAFDKLVGQLRSALSDADPVLGLNPEEFLDLKLDSRVRGKSVRVLPLAIFS
ncbi:DUF6414 family protein [Microbacterium sp. TPU 3598]|uniref:DUF6414 family protein n=1 Tax=Microbacterium sp. TPU 3598 TaxID=1938334 RepID=UPI000BBADE4D|nr:hypothetical protein [Microbacterium sp. TPU 3598]